VVSVDDRVTRVIRYGLARATIRLEKGLSFLATVGSSAPFIGLFGTVWGILHALRGISAGGIAQLDKISGPISEALVMTAFGLAVAIPALIFYNTFIRMNRVLLVDLDGFAYDLHRYFSEKLSSEEHPSEKKV
jgi:biopolymer transport protein ExbB